jgi:hypothetical protein
VSEPGNDKGTSARAGLAGVAALALVIGCCGAFPLVVVLASSVALGTLLGIGAGIVALIALLGLLVVRARRRAACEPLEPRFRPSRGPIRGPKLSESERTERT